MSDFVSLPRRGGQVLRLRPEAVVALFDRGDGAASILLAGWPMWEHLSCTAAEAQAIIDGQPSADTAPRTRSATRSCEASPVASQAQR